MLNLNIAATYSIDCRNSNTTFVNVKHLNTGASYKTCYNSNTTFVNVKQLLSILFSFFSSIQIQLLLMLNYNRFGYNLDVTSNSNTTFVNVKQAGTDKTGTWNLIQIQLLLMLNAKDFFGLNVKQLFKYNFC